MFVDFVTSRITSGMVLLNAMESGLGEYGAYLDVS